MATKVKADNGALPSPTPASQWVQEAEEGVLIRLRSGNLARVRPVNLDAFIEGGYIPDNLTPVIDELINGRETGKRATREDFNNNQQMLDAFCKACFMEPKVADVADPANGVISVKHISDIDKQDLFSFMGASAEDLKRFHPLEENPVDDLDSQPGDTASAE